MSRQRIFVPGFWASKKIKRLYREHGADAVLFYWGLNSHADDEGRGYNDLDWFELKMPFMATKFSAELVTNWLQTGNKLELIQLYKNENSFYFIPDWFEKQKIPKPFPSEISLPPKEFTEKFPNYFLELQAQLNKILQRFTKDKRVTNQLRTSSCMKLKEVKLKEVKLKEVKGVAKTPDKNAAFFIILKADEGIFNIYQDDLAQWKELFPSIDLEYHIKKIVQWNNVDCVDKRKTARGIRKHITGWLAKEQEASKKQENPKKQSAFDKEAEENNALIKQQMKDYGVTGKNL